MVIEIELSKTGKKHAGKYVAIVDDCDGDLAELNWVAKVKSKPPVYVSREVKENGIAKKLYLHRVIMERMQNGVSLADNQQIDHVDNNGLNNTRENLRLAT